MEWWAARKAWRRGSTRARALALGDALVGQDASKLSLHTPPRKNGVSQRVPVGMFTPLAERLAATRGPGRPDYLLLLVVAALLARGITTWLLVQALVNIGSVTSSIPFTSMPLPFVSFGGSSLVTSLVAVGILLNISRRARV